MKLRYKAFTMIELIVVIAVILVLTAFTIYSLGPARAKSRDSRRITDANLIMNALDQYYTSKLRTYPTEDTPDSSDSKYHAVKVTANSLSMLSDYLNPIPVDPINDGTHRYIYIYRGDGKKAAVVVDKLESMITRCNTSGTDMPDSVKAYLTGQNLAGGGVPANPNACYYVAR